VKEWEPLQVVALPALVVPKGTTVGRGPETQALRWSLREKLVSLAVPKLRGF